MIRELVLWPMQENGTKEARALHAAALWQLLATGDIVLVDRKARLNPGQMVETWADDAVTYRARALLRQLDKQRRIVLMDAVGNDESLCHLAARITSNPEWKATAVVPGACHCGHGLCQTQDDGQPVYEWVTHRGLPGSTALPAGRCDTFFNAAWAPIFRPSRQLKLVDRYLGRHTTKRGSVDERWQRSIFWIVDSFFKATRRTESFSPPQVKIITGTGTSRKGSDILMIQRALEALQKDLCKQYGTRVSITLRQEGHLGGELPHARFIITDQAAWTIDPGIDVLDWGFTKTRHSRLSLDPRPVAEVEVQEGLQFDLNWMKAYR